jgi:hypothetical protein
MTERLYKYGKAKTTNETPQLEQSSSLLLAEKCKLSIENHLPRRCLDQLSVYQETPKRPDDIHRCRVPTYLEFKSDPIQTCHQTDKRIELPNRFCVLVLQFLLRSLEGKGNGFWSSVDYCNHRNQTFSPGRKIATPPEVPNKGKFTRWNHQGQ